MMSIQAKSKSAKMSSKRGNKLHCDCPKEANADIFCTRAHAWYLATASRGDRIKKDEKSLQSQYSKLKRLYKELLKEKLDSASLE